MKPNKQNRLKRTSQIWRPSEIPADAGPKNWFLRIYLKLNVGANYVGPRKKPNEQVRLKRTFQIWRPSEFPANAGPQILFSRIR